MNKRKAAFWVGVAMMAAGVVGLLRIPGFYLNNYMTGQRLTREAVAMVKNGNSVSGNTASGVSVNQTGGVPAPGSLQLGQNSTDSRVHEEPAPVLVSTIPLALPPQHALMGLVVIPRLQLKAPVVQGTDEAVLNTSVGHLSDSAMPGQPGITVLAAHNATWFRHVDELQNGDTISVSLQTGTYEYAVTGHAIVHTGDALSNTAQSMLILESCYPLDALYLTPKRYLVYAKLVRIVPHITGSTNNDTGADGGSTGTGAAGEGNATTGGSTLQSSLLTKLQVRAKVPTDLQHEGLLLHENALPLGTLQYNSQPSMAFTESSVPLQVTNTMVQLFEAYVHASAEKRDADLQSLFASLPVSSTQTNPLYGVSLSDITYVDPLSFTLVMASGDRLERVNAETTVRIRGRVLHLSLTADAAASPNANNPEILWLTLKKLSFATSS